jgi:hypothetical protein
MAARSKSSTAKAGTDKPQEAPAAEAVAEDVDVVPDWPGAWPETLPSGLWPRLLLAQAHGGSISKKGENKHHNYEYVKAEDVIRDASKILSRAGLVATVDPWEIKLSEGATSNSKRSVECEAKSTLWIVNPEAPEEKVGFPIIGTGTDSPGDKAIYKAQTGGKKYAWQDALTLAFGDDPEDTSSPGAQGAAEQQVRGSSGPPFGLALADKNKAPVRDAAAVLLTFDESGPQTEAATDVLASISKDCGYMPKVVGDVVYRLYLKLGELDPSILPDPPPPDEDAAAKAEAEKAQAAAEDPDPDPASEEAPDDLPPASGGIEEELPADTAGLGGPYDTEVDEDAGDPDEPRF